MRTASLIAALLVAAPLAAQHTVIHIAEAGTPVTIALTDTDLNLGGFHRIGIDVGGHITTFIPSNPVICAPQSPSGRKADISWAGIDGMTLDNSLCFYRANYGGTKNHTVIVFIGDLAASNAAPVFIVGFHANGTPYKILERNELSIFAFHTREDGSAQLIGYPSFSQIMFGEGFSGDKKPYVTTYDPRAVYIFIPDKPAAYSLSASRQYNLQHYVWAGPHVSEKIGVVYNYPERSHPFVVPSAQVDALMAKLPGSSKP